MPTTAAEKVAVAVGLIIRDDRVLISQRQSGSHMAHKWEFPGGKVEIGEPPETALRRELHEELNIQLQDVSYLFDISYSYPEKAVVLHLFSVQSFQGTAYGKEGQQIQWCPVKRLREFDFPPANEAILRHISENFSISL